MPKKIHQCQQCDYRTTQKSNLNAHIHTHTGEKPYACELCNYRAATSSGLIVHMRSHTGDKPFACDKCDYRATQKSDVTRHKRIHTGDKPYACTLCAFRTAEKSNLTRHKRSHTGSKPFACDKCDYRATQKSNLTTHMRIHTGDKPFACDFCDYRTADKSSLRRHKRTHTGDKPFACDFCDYRTAKKSDLTTHMQSKKHKMAQLACNQSSGLALLVGAAANIEAAAPVAIKQEPPLLPPYSYSNDAQFTFDFSVAETFPLTGHIYLPTITSEHHEQKIKAQLKQTLSRWLTRTTFNITINPAYQFHIERLIQVFTINPCDPRVGLRGQRGLKSKCLIPAHTPAGIYVGNVYNDDAATDASLADIPAWEQPRNFLFNLAGSINKNPYQLVIDAENCGNWTALINANTIYTDGEPAADANCEFIKVHYQGFPLIVVMTNRDIKSGEELLVDYGRDYWLSFEENMQRFIKAGSADEPIIIE